VPICLQVHSETQLEAVILSEAQSKGLLLAEAITTATSSQPASPCRLNSRTHSQRCIYRLRSISLCSHSPVKSGWPGANHTRARDLWRSVPAQVAANT